MLRTRILAASCVIALAGAAANAAILNLGASLSGANEVPPNNSQAFGVAALTFDTDTNTITSMRILLFGINRTDIILNHIHRAPAGVNGPVIVDFGDVTQWVNDSGGLSRTFTNLAFPAADVGNLLSRGTYINIHTNAFPGGELRGQIVPTPGSLALLTAGGLVAIRRRRR